MMNLDLRAAGLLGAVALFAYACGGSSFNAGGGGGTAGASGAVGTAGTSAHGGSSSSAGTHAGGTVGEAGESQGGTAAGGAPEGGAPEGGTSSGGTASGGMSTGGTAAGGTSRGGAAGKGGSSGSGGVTSKNSGDCSSDTECMGGKCEALYPGGFRTCVTPVTVTCTALDACCPSLAKDCAAGTTCVKTPVGPSCGGALMQSKIECVKEGCNSAADCTGNNAICVPGGAFDYKVSTCLTGGCRLDTDCKDIAGGKCEPVTTNCCNGPTGLYCVYPGKGCRSNADCANGTTCQIAGKNGQCVSGTATCAG